MRLWPRSRPKSLKSVPSDLALPPPKLLTNDPFNRHAAMCQAVSAYHDRQARSLSPTSLFCSPRTSYESSSPTSRHPMFPKTRSSSIWDIDGAQTSFVHIPSRRGGRQSSLQSFYNSPGDAPASPPIQWDASDVTSVETAVKLLQGVAIHHDVDRSVQAVCDWLKSLPSRDSTNATARIRLATIQHFSRIWNPSPKESRISREDIEARVAVARLFGLLLHANLLQSADVALASEFLLKHHHRTGYLQGLHQLVSTAGDALFHDAALMRMVTVAKSLEMAREKLCCSFRRLSASSSTTKMSKPPSKSEGRRNPFMKKGSFLGLPRLRIADMFFCVNRFMLYELAHHI